MTLKSPSHELLNAWFEQGYLPGIRLDRLQEFTHDVRSRVAKLRRDLKSAQVTMESSRISERNASSDAAHQAIRDAHHQLSVLVPALRHAQKMALQLSRGQPIARPRALAEFLACRALRAPSGALNAPLERSREWLADAVRFHIPQEEAVIARALINKHAQLFAAEKFALVGSRLPTRAELEMEQAQARANERLRRLKKIIKKVIAAGILTAEEVELLQTMR